MIVEGLAQGVSPGMGGVGTVVHPVLTPWATLSRPPGSTRSKREGVQGFLDRVGEGGLGSGEDVDETLEDAALGGRKLVTVQ